MRGGGGDIASCGWTQDRASRVSLSLANMLDQHKAELMGGAQ